MSTHFSHGLAIQVELVAAEANSPSLRVLFHGLETSRRSAFQSSAEACYRQVRGLKRSPCHAAVLHVRTSRLRGMHCQVQALDYEALSGVVVNSGQSRPWAEALIQRRRWAPPRRGFLISSSARPCHTTKTDGVHHCSAMLVSCWLLSWAAQPWISADGECKLSKTITQPPL